VDISSASDELSLTIYPFFDLRGKGIAEVLLPDFYSYQLGNVRDINVYWPYSLIENPTPRKINVLVVHDGTLDALKVFADTSAVDSLNAVGSIPEVIMIGLPNSPNGTACPSELVEAGLCVQRNYELTPTVCDPATNFCPEFQPTGGADEYLEFVYADVIPAVLERLGQFELGEVSNVGFR
jgi:enterochelin esterase-like enzyme